MNIFDKCSKRNMEKYSRKMKKHCDLPFGKRTLTHYMKCDKAIKLNNDCLAKINFRKVVPLMFSRERKRSSKKKNKKKKKKVIYKH